MFLHDFKIALSWEDKFQNKILLTYQTARMDYFVKIDNYFLIISQRCKKILCFFSGSFFKSKPSGGTKKAFFAFLQN